MIFFWFSHSVLFKSRLVSGLFCFKRLLIHNFLFNFIHKKVQNSEIFLFHLNIIQKILRGMFDNATIYNKFDIIFSYYLFHSQKQTLQWEYKKMKNRLKKTCPKILV